MRTPLSVWSSVKNFVVQYPAVLSGYVIYSYLFLCLLRFFLLVQSGEASFLRVYETFIAVPFLWLLALSLVKVIEIRTRLHETETLALKAQGDLDRKYVQLTTLHEVIRGVQDRVNNPLEAIMMQSDTLADVCSGKSEGEAAVGNIKESAKAIAHALAAFNSMEEYRTEAMGGDLGRYVSPDGPDQARSTGG